MFVIIPILSLSLSNWLGGGQSGIENYAGPILFIGIRLQIRTEKHNFWKRDVHQVNYLAESLFGVMFLQKLFDPRRRGQVLKGNSTGS